MQKITIADDAGQLLTARVPSSWAEVPFYRYAAFAATARPVSITDPFYPGLHAYANVAGCHALAALVGLPGEVLCANVARLLPFYEAAPWLFAEQLPPAAQLATSFTHLGTRYRYASQAEVGPAVAAWREQSLRWLLRETDSNLADCGTALLAVLYTPDAGPGALASLQASGAGLASLPMSIAWPALLQFCVPGMPLTEPVERYLALRPMVTQALQGFEQALATAPPAPAPSAPRWWVALRRHLGWAA